VVIIAFEQVASNERELPEKVSVPTTRLSNDFSGSHLLDLSFSLFLHI